MKKSLKLIIPGGAPFILKKKTRNSNIRFREEIKLGNQRIKKGVYRYCDRHGKMIIASKVI